MVAAVKSQYHLTTGLETPLASGYGAVLTDNFEVTTSGSLSTNSAPTFFNGFNAYNTSSVYDLQINGTLYTTGTTFADDIGADTITANQINATSDLTISPTNDLTLTGVNVFVSAGTAIDITGDTTVHGTTTISGDFIADGVEIQLDASVDGQLYVTGTSHLAGIEGDSLHTTDSISADGDLTVATDKFIVDSATGDVTVGRDLTVTGNLTVNGDTTTVNTATLDVEDLNITVAKGAATAAAANGAGITIDGASANITYASTGDKFNINKPINVTGNITSSATVSGSTGSFTTLGASGVTTLAETHATTLYASLGVELSSTLSVTGQTTVSTLKFSDNSVQSTAGASTGKAIAMAIVFGG